MVVMPAKGREEAELLPSARVTGEDEACAKSIEARDKRERRVAAWAEVKKRVLWAASWSVVAVQWACMTRWWSGSWSRGEDGPVHGR